SGNVADGRNLPEQAGEVVTPVVKRIGRPGYLRGPADLALQLLEELADLVRRSLGLRALHADAEARVIARQELKLKYDIGDQREANDRHERSRIFQKETRSSRASPFPASRRIGPFGADIHSTTSSARARIRRLTVKPS